MYVGHLREISNVIHGEAPLANVTSIPGGARWSTVRPNGLGTEAHTVLIQLSPSGAFHVIGGGGGKLNYLKLTGVRGEEDYAQRQREGAKARKEKKQEQRKMRKIVSHPVVYER